MKNPATANSSKVLECFPMMGSTALFMEHGLSDEGVAMTNGRQVLFGPAFFVLPEPQKNGVVLHEYLHCVLSHPQRGGLLYLKDPQGFCATTFNVAADAIINHTIRAEAKTWAIIDLPPNTIDFDKVRKDLETLEIIEKDSITPQSINVENLYFLLLKAKQMPCPTEGITAVNEEIPQTDETSKKQAWKRLQDLCNGDSDLSPDKDSHDKLKEKIREQIARNKNASTVAGKEAGNLLERIKGDIPRPSVPWESAFRTVTAKWLTKERRRNHRRPSNSMLSHEAMGGAHFWEAGRMRSPRPRVLVIADSSGSINMKDYLRFLGELQGMKKRTSAEILFGQADTELTEVVQIKDVKQIRNLSLKGRGGTSFVQPLEYGERMEVDLIIYMTDLHGEFPEKCDVPVIWVSVNNEKTIPPFGRHFKVNS